MDLRRELTLAVARLEILSGHYKAVMADIGYLDDNAVARETLATECYLALKVQLEGIQRHVIDEGNKPKITGPSKVYNMGSIKNGVFSPPARGQEWLCAECHRVVPPQMEVM